MELKSTRTGFYYGWVIVIVSFLLMMFAYVSFVSTVGVFIIPVTEELGIDRASFVVYMTILSLTTVVVTSFMGKVMAKRNIKMIMFVSAIIACIGFFGFSRATSAIHFYIFAVLLGIAFGCLTTMPISILLNNWFGGKIRGTAMGIAFMGSGFGGMIMTPLLNAIITNYGWRYGYLSLLGIFLIILIPCILLFIVKTPEEKGLQRLGETKDESNITGEKQGMSFKEAKKTPMLWMMLISVVLVIFGSSSILANAVPFYIESGFSAAAAANLAGLALGALMIGKPTVGFICDRLGIRFGAISSALVFSIGFLVLFFVPQIPSLVYVYILCYLYAGAAITVCPPLMINGLFGEKDYGMIVGLVTMFTSIGGAFGGTIAAWVFDKTGSYTSFWLVAAVALGIATILRALCFVERKRYDF